MIRDGDWLLVKWDAQTGKSVWRREFDGEITYRVDEPVDNLVKMNADVRNNSAGNAFGDWTKIASIPANIVWNDENGLMKAFNEGDDKHVSRWLNDGDNRAWRTFEGKV